MTRGLIFAGLLALAAGVSCFGQTIDDPLHGYCSSGCVDNGTNSPTTENPITGFGFTVSPGPASGDLLIEILVPYNEQSQVTAADLDITGTGVTNTGTATLFNATDWSSGKLDAYLGLSASPANPIGAYGSSSGFYVYQLDAGAVTLEGASDPNVSPLLDVGPLPYGAYIVGFLNEGTTASPDWIATANSGAIIEVGTDNGGGSPGGSPTTPEPASIFLTGTISLIALTALRKKLQTRS